MFILGITGGIGSGKTAATNRFSTHGIDIVDADEVAHNIVIAGSPALKEIKNHFGSDILLQNGELDRKLLRDIIFENDDERLWLEGYLHPLIRDRLFSAVGQSSSLYTILSAPLLLEKDLVHYVDRLLVIDCPEAMQVDRSCRRDNTSIESVQKIMQQQVSRRERIAKADDIIVNDGTIEELYQAVDQYHIQLLKELALENT